MAVVEKLGKTVHIPFRGQNGRCRVPSGVASIVSGAGTEESLRQTRIPLKGAVAWFLHRLEKSVANFHTTGAA